MKKQSIFALALAGAMLLSGCAASQASVNSAVDSAAQTASASQQTSSASQETSSASQSAASLSEMISNRDLEVGYDASESAVITLTGDSAQCDSDAVQISGSTVTITDEGTYILTGTLTEVGAGRLPPEAVETILLSRDRAQAGPTAPAQGLCLLETRYEI